MSVFSEESASAMEAAREESPLFISAADIFTGRLSSTPGAEGKESSKMLFWRGREEQKADRLRAPSETRYSRSSATPEPSESAISADFMPNPSFALALSCASWEGIAGRGMNKTRRKAMKRSAMAPTSLRIIVYWGEGIKSCLSGRAKAPKCALLGAGFIYPQNHIGSAARGWQKELTAVNCLSTARRTQKTVILTLRERRFPVSNKEEGTSLPALARAGIIRISRSFPSRIRAFGGGEQPLNNRPMPA